jgi:hypothetical protein
VPEQVPKFLGLQRKLGISSKLTYKPSDLNCRPCYSLWRGPCRMGLVMQHVVTWWCTLLGITDPVSIQIASGIVGGSTLIYSPFVAWWLFSAIIGRWVR